MPCGAVRAAVQAKAGEVLFLILFGGFSKKLNKKIRCCYEQYLSVGKLTVTCHDRLLGELYFCQVQPSVLFYGSWGKCRAVGS